MGAHEYLEKYVRSVPGGALAWERSIFSRTGQWDASELIDAAVDIVWDAFGGESALERAAVDVRRNGNFIVFAPLSVPNGDFLRIAA